MRGGDAAEITRFEEDAGLGVTRERPGLITLRFYSADDAPRLYPDWLEDARRRGAKRLRLLTLADFGAALDKPQGGPPIADRQLAGFANTHETVLGLQLPDEVVGLRLNMAYPPPTTLTHEDVLRFIEEAPEREHLRSSLLWQDAHNLHFADGKDFDTLIAAVTPERETRFVEMFSMSVSNVAVSEATQRRWLDLRRERRTRLAPELRAVEFAAAPSARSAAPDRAAARATLERALDACLAYARSKSLAPWDEVFAGALAVLRDGPKPPLAGPDAVFARLYPADAARLLSAASRADVFGAMGSWNDLGLDGDAEYDRVSEALFRCLPDALAAACASVG